MKPPCRVLVLLAAALAAAACGSGADETASVSAQESPRSRCDKPGVSSLAAAVCASSGAPALDTAKVERTLPQIPPKSPSCASAPTLLFYAADDWMGLGAALARGGPPCARYLISIPPVKDEDGLYTVPNPSDLRLYRALGPRFQAMAEIRVAAWEQWLAANPGKSWYDAGVEARRRMARAGYDPARGDTWAVNEFPLDVLTDQAVRDDMRELVRGLYEGGPPMKGVVFLVSPAQAQTELEPYKAQLEANFRDLAFWQELRRSVRYVAAEVYASATSCCVPGASGGEQAADLNSYLQHRFTLAQAAPPELSLVRSYLEEAYVPLGNAAWAWEAAYGYTAISPEQMARFLANQTLAMQSFAVPQNRSPVFGFAWAPLQPEGMSKDQFVASVERIRDELARSLRESFTLGPRGACGNDGRGCRCEVAGSAFNPAWRTFERWG
jgi:hypothetical protein